MNMEAGRAISHLFLPSQDYDSFSEEIPVLYKRRKFPSHPLSLEVDQYIHFRSAKTDNE